MNGIGKARYSLPSSLAMKTAIASDPSHSVTMIVCQSCLEYVESCGETQQLRPDAVIGEERIAGEPPVHPSPIAKVNRNEDEAKETLVVDHSKAESSRARKRAQESEEKDSAEWTEEEISLVSAILSDKSFHSARYGFSINVLQLEDLFLRPPYCKLSSRSSRAVLKKINELLLDALAAANSNLSHIPMVVDAKAESHQQSGVSTSLTLLGDAADLIRQPGMSGERKSKNMQIETFVEGSQDEATIKTRPAIDQGNLKFVKPKKKKLRK